MLGCDMIPKKVARSALRVAPDPGDVAVYHVNAWSAMNYSPAVSPVAQADEGIATEQPSGTPDRAVVGFDLRLLESFVVLASELHFGRAAERLAFAQPALSQQIRRLEAQLGSALFLRDTRRVELTAAGTAFLPHAHASLAAAVDARAAVTATERAVGGRLPLSVNSDALDYSRDVLQAFIAAHPDVHLDVTLRFDDESPDALARHTVDASILWSDDGPPAGFEDTSGLLAAPGAGIAMKATHPLAMQPLVDVDQLEGQRLVMFPRERASALYDRIVDHLGGTARFRSIHHVTTIGQGVAADMLSALDEQSITASPQWSRLGRSPEGFVWKPLIPAVSASLWLVWTGVPTEPTRALATFADQARATREPSLTLV
jgi:DNA-binding transcriptional LysR family regulator